MLSPPSLVRRSLSLPALLARLGRFRWPQLSARSSRSSLTRASSHESPGAWAVASGRQGRARILRVGGLEQGKGWMAASRASDCPACILGLVWRGPWGPYSAEPCSCGWPRASQPAGLLRSTRLVPSPSGRCGARHVRFSLRHSLGRASCCRRLAAALWRGSRGLRRSSAGSSGASPHVERVRLDAEANDEARLLQGNARVRVTRGPSRVVAFVGW